MTTIQHTPGPWITNLLMDGRHHYLPIMTNAWEKDVDGAPYHSLIGNIWFTRGHAPREVAEANALLIAAAPDLLTTAESLLAYIDAYLSPSDGPLLQDARNIIAKSKGKDHV